MSGKGLHIVLIGFMGSGKTTIGKMVAERLNRPFIDTDRLIEKNAGKSIAQIFEEEGETYFRNEESRTLQSVLNSETPSVIATGGGAPCFLDGMQFIKNSSYSIYLRVGRKRLFERIMGDKSRPLAGHKTKRELVRFIDETLSKREKYYRQANRIILGFGPPENIVKRIYNYTVKKNL